MVPDSAISGRAHRVAVAKATVRNKLFCEHTFVVSTERPKPPWWASDVFFWWSPPLIVCLSTLFIWLLVLLLNIELF